MGIALAIALVAFGGAHVLLVGGLFARQAWWHALAALVILPLAPWWGWAAGMRARTLVWGGALALYALGVVVA